MDYTKEDILRDRVRRSNGHSFVMDGQLKTIDFERVRERHLSDFARALDKTNSLSMKIEAVEYINKILKGDRHSRKEREFIARSGTTATISNQEKGFWGKIKRKVRKIKDVFNPSDRKLLEDSATRLARDIARYPDRYAGNDVYALFDNYKIKHNEMTREDVQYSIKRKREDAARIKGLRDTKPTTRAVKQTVINKEMISSRTIND